MVKYNGNTNSFTGNGTINPQKLYIPNKNAITDPAVQSAMLQLEQWLNALVSTGLCQISHTYAVSGTLAVPSGATGYLPPFYMPADVNQGVELLAVRTSVRSGSCTINIEQNGGVIATGVAVTTTPTNTAIGVSVATDDSFQPVITAVSSADGLSVAFFFGATS